MRRYRILLWFNTRPPLPWFAYLPFYHRFIFAYLRLIPTELRRMVCWRYAVPLPTFGPLLRATHAQFSHGCGFTYRLPTVGRMITTYHRTPRTIPKFYCAYFRCLQRLGWHLALLRHTVAAALPLTAYAVTTLFSLTVNCRCLCCEFPLQLPPPLRMRVRCHDRFAAAPWYTTAFTVPVKHRIRFGYRPFAHTWLATCRWVGLFNAAAVALVVTDWFGVPRAPVAVLRLVPLLALYLAMYLRRTLVPVPATDPFSYPILASLLVYLIRLDLPFVFTFPFPFGGYYSGRDSLPAPPLRCSYLPYVDPIVLPFPVGFPRFRLQCL